MEFEICLEPSGVRFTADAHQNIVAAAKEHGIPIKHGCASGSCGDCKGTILDGDSEQGPFMPLLLSPTERAANMAILCKLYPRSPMRLRAEIVQKTLWTAQVTQLAPLAWNVMELRVQPEHPYPYRTGQYARIGVPGQPEQWRSYSVATPPTAQGELVFHIRELPGGAFSQWLFQNARIGDTLQLGSPQGEFFLRQESPLDLLCIAAGTGLAPIEAILQESFDLGWKRPIHLFYGAKKREDFYHSEKLAGWSRHYPHLQVTPTLSDMTDAGWTGARRLLPTVASHGPWKDHEIYLCGSPGMIEAAIDLLLSHGTPHEQIHFDAFSPNG
ncbi:FAD-binding oxidoreductase [Acidithiobacillus ferrianus]|uniref:2Fe-2S iron-sulfur cluster binding domain-containing protein n=2 Tax=Acidithiobacillus ferrianus TaxID=2678518 RepID=A0A845U8I1_9PROT|nr:FAD-binding oxidoreductase [Acidithiobacillus ferrianus]NDU43163.1 2Fe-2S iron-sulfur cluster binding domain-containing protein [Acidithiobacillus ferrianus]